MTDPDSGDMLAQFVKRAGALYSLPSVAIEVLALTDRPNVDVQALKVCVERDPALTAKILRVVNSSVFGLSREVSDLNQGLALLGAEPLKLLVLGFSLPESLFSDVEASMLERFWRFALIKAVAARRLAGRFWNYPQDEAFIAGLLQEIGTLLLIRELGEPYVHFLKSAIAMGEDVTSMENSVLGFNHARLSSQLLDSWNLPKKIVDAIGRPLEIEQLVQLPPTEQALPQILHIATLIAAIIVDHRNAAMSELLAAAERYQLITIDQINAELDSLQEQVELMAGVFAVPINNPLSYRDILADAHRAIATISVGAVAGLFETSPPEHTSAERLLLADAANELSQAAYDALPVSPSGMSVRNQLLANGVNAAATVALAPVMTGCAISDPSLNGRLVNALSIARQHRCELSLVLTEIVNYTELILVTGPAAASTAIQTLQSLLKALSSDAGSHLLVSDYRYASVLVGYDRRRSVEFGRRLLRATPNWATERCGLTLPIQCVAAVVSSTLPGRSYTPDEFTEAAERCLFAARSSGGGSIKSIDLL